MISREIHIRRFLERRKPQRPLWWLIALLILVILLFRYLRIIAD